METKHSKTVQVRMSVELLELVDRAAAACGPETDRSRWIRDAIRGALDRGRRKTKAQK